MLVITALGVRVITFKEGGLLIHTFVWLPLDFQTSVQSGDSIAFQTQNSSEEKVGDLIASP